VSWRSEEKQALAHMSKEIGKRLGNRFEIIGASMGYKNVLN
jgi:hypothetical protein